MGTQRGNLPPIQTLKTTFFAHEVVVEIIFRSQKYTDDEEEEILKYFYSDIINLNTNNKLLLAKTLIAYRRFGHLSMILEDFARISKGKTVQIGVESLDVANQLSEITKLQTFITEFVLIVVEKLLETENIVFLAKLTEKYEILVSGSSMPIVSKIVKNIEKLYDSEMPILNFMEKVLILTHLTTEFLGDTKTIEGLLMLFQKLIRAPAQRNVVAN